MIWDIGLKIILVFSILLACTGTNPGGSGSQSDVMKLIPERLNNITDIEWHLKTMQMDNKSIPIIKDTKITFSCDEKGKVAGLASINRYFGSFTLTKDGVLIWSKAFGMTRMAGPPELMEQETKFMQALPLTSRISLENENLVMISSDQSTRLEFEKN